MEYPKFRVCVRCLTFNQSMYIIDALNGFTMQQTSFPFVCTIVDDASTDGEQEVIRKYIEENFDFSEGSVAFQKETDYAHIIYAQHKTNKNCYFVVLYLKENHYSQKKDKIQYLEEWRGMCEYEALCEGDDYWIVPYKLENQVKEMDKDSSLSLCAHGFYEYNLRKNKTKTVLYNGSFNGLETLFKYQNMISTNSLLYRRECRDKLNSEFLNKYIRFDYSLKTILVMQGNVKVLPQIMSVYRLYASSSWTSRTRTDTSFLIKHHLFAIESYKQIQSLFSERYYDILQNEIVRRETIIAILKRDISTIRKKPWSDVFSNMPFRVRLHFYITQFFLHIFKIYKKLNPHHVL